MEKHELRAWERLETHLLLDHPWCRIAEDRVRLPSGQQVLWWRFAASADVACIICCDTNQRILLAYHYNNAPQRVVDEFPGGGIEAHESGDDAARRELLEETGLYAHSICEIGSFLINNRRSAQRMRVFVATDMEQLAATPEPSEYIAYEWVGIEEVNQRIRQGVLVNGMLLAAWSLFQAYRSDGASNR
jgi:ADP-ribose pyrophosphatase